MRSVSRARAPAQAGAQHRTAARPGSRPRGGTAAAWTALAATLLLSAAPAAADSLMPAAALADTQLPDARQEAKAKALMETLRCLVCQGQSIADSNAEMAGDMRALVRRRIAAGESPESIRAWLVQRYGAWVSYDPPLEGLTWPLWLLPLALLGVGAWLARGRFRRRAR